MEPCDWHSQHPGNLKQLRDTDAKTTILYRCDARLVAVQALGKLLLRKTERAALGPKTCADVGIDWVGHRAT